MEQLCGENPGNARWRTFVERARATNAKRDGIDRQFGCAVPSIHPFEELRTALSALSAGIAMNDWDCIAEGFVMLQHAELRLRPQLWADFERHLRPGTMPTEENVW